MKMAPDPLIQHILNFKELQRRYDIIDAQRKEIAAQMDQLRLHEIPNEMANRDMTSLKGEWGRCTLTADLSISVRDKLTLHQWLEENGQGDLIQPTVNSSTLKAWVKEQMGAGSPVPDVIKISPFSRAVLYKS